MNRFATYALAAFAICCAALPARAVPTFIENPAAGSGVSSLISNGDFEINGGNGSQPTGWFDVFNFRGVWRVSTEQSFFGDYSVKSHPNTFSGPGYVLAQTIATIPGAEYVLSAYFYNAGVTTAQVYVDTNDTLTDPNLGAGIDFTPDTWVLGYDTFTATSTSTTLRLVMDGNVTPGQTMYIDGVGVTLAENFVADTAVPEPGAFAILGIGLAALVITRRRRAT